jgi:hypothetical protein
VEGILDYKRDNAVAVSKHNGFVVTRRGQKKMQKRTQGWKLLIKWANGSESWIALKDMTESHPIEMAEFARARNIVDEPAFAWWVLYTLRKRNTILCKIKTRIRRTTHKYGIKVPTGIEHAMQLDQDNGNAFWRDVLALEMTNVGVAFEVLERSQFVPPGWKKVTGHLVWDLKMDFTRKA